MKPSKFKYVSPRSRAEMLELKATHVDSRILAGGQSLIPMMNFRLTAPPMLIDVSKVPDMAYIEDAGEEIHIGAMTRYRTLECSGLIDRHLPLLGRAIQHVAHLPIRSRGTIGGSLANADPAAEMPMTLLALGGSVVVESIRGARAIEAEELFLSMFTTSIEADEVLTEVRIPKMACGAKYAVAEHARRVGDFAIVAVAANLKMQGDVCLDARVSIAGVGESQRRLRVVEQILRGSHLDDAVLRDASKGAADSVDAQSDANASAEFRRHLTSVLCHRALSEARDQVSKG